jgi:hypothetical protein
MNYPDATASEHVFILPFFFQSLPLKRDKGVNYNRLGALSLPFSPPFVTRRREDLLLQPERIEAKIDGTK